LIAAVRRRREEEVWEWKRRKAEEVCKWRKRSA
jgi:hypothetical protein